MEVSCVSCSRALSLSLLHSSSSSSPSSSNSIGNLRLWLNQDQKKRRNTNNNSKERTLRIRSSAEGRGERSIDDADRRRSSFAAGGIEVSASSTSTIERTFGTSRDADFAMWEKMGAVVRLSYGIGNLFLPEDSSSPKYFSLSPLFLRRNSPWVKMNDAGGSGSQMAQNKETEPEWDLAKIPCYCEVTSMCKLLTAKTPSNRGRKFLKCAKENDGCDFWCWTDELRFCRCEVGFCKIRTSKMPMSFGQKFYCCPSSTSRENPGCEYIDWMQKSKPPRQKKKLVDDVATTFSGQSKDITKEILLEVEIEHRVAQRQVELYGSFLKKFGEFQI